MSKPIVAMVGRPNVGKSTLFNKLAGKRISIVQDTPGVTRDRVYAEAEWLSHTFTMIDTGGIEPENQDIILTQMRRQANIAIETADVIVFIVDGKEGLTAADHEVATMLRKSKKPIVLVVNKVDSLKEEDNAWEFYNLGIGDPITISASQGLGLGDMLDEVVKYFNDPSEDEEDDEYIRIAMIGKPNVGKSSLLNYILGENRAIVTEIAGTTRDVIEEFVNIKGIPLKIVDTAGIRETEDIVEKIGVEKSRESLNSADLVIIVIDGSKELEQEDKEILEQAIDKKTIVLLNKNDLPQAVSEDDIAKYVDKDSIIKISALKNEGIEEVHDKIESMVFKGDIKSNSSVVVTNTRHKDALLKAYNSINDAIAGIEQRLPYDFIEVDFKNIWDYLGYINGDTVQDDLLDTIFANFCIGK